MIAIIDYGAGNLQSVKKALDYIGAESKITMEKNEINAASHIILPVPWRGAGFAAPAASRFPPDGEAASGGHISFCEERNVGKKVA